MNPRVLVLVMALLCGIGAFFLARNYMKKGTQGPKMVKVLRTKIKIPPREKITDPTIYFEEKEMPEGSFPQKTLREFDKLKDKSLNKFVAAEYFVTEDDLLAPGQADLTDQLAPGMRLLGLGVNAESLAGGFVLPGTKVDVNGTKRTGNGNVESHTIFQNIRVMAVGEKTSITAEGKPSLIEPTVTLEVTLEQFNVLSLWKTQGGEIKLAPRSASDVKEVKVNPTKLFQDKEPEKPIVKENTTPPMPKAVVKTEKRHQLLILDARETKGGNGSTGDSVVFVQDEKGRWRTQLGQVNPELGGYGSEKKDPMPEEPPQPMEIRKNKGGS